MSVRQRISTASTSNLLRDPKDRSKETCQISQSSGMNKGQGAASLRSVKSVTVCPYGICQWPTEPNIFMFGDHPEPGLGVSNCVDIGACLPVLGSRFLSSPIHQSQHHHPSARQIEQNKGITTHHNTSLTPAPCLNFFFIHAEPYSKKTQFSFTLPTPA